MTIKTLAHEYLRIKEAAASALVLIAVSLFKPHYKNFKLKRLFHGNNKFTFNSGSFYSRHKYFRRECNKEKP